MDSIETLEKAIKVLNAEYENNLKQFAMNGILTESAIIMQTVIEYNMHTLEETLYIFNQEIQDEDWEEEDLPELEASFENELNLANAILGLPKIDYHEFSSYNHDEYDYTDDDTDFTYSDSHENSETFFYEIKDYSSRENKTDITSVAGIINLENYQKAKFNILDEAYIPFLAKTSDKMKTVFEAIDKVSANDKPESLEEKLKKILSITPLEAYRNKDYMQGWLTLKEQILTLLKDEENDS